MNGWTAADIPDQSGRIALVTGANSGIGLVAGRELAGAGAAVKLACRDTAKGKAAADAIRKSFPAADVEVLGLDLADLASVRELASGIGIERLDLLVNNAGVMASPRRETADGFELQLGTNHLGHFALTGLLLDKLKASPGARVVTVSSGAHRIGRINFDNLQGERHYMRWSAYGQSKLANLLFAFELNRRAEAAGLVLRSMAAHPGYAATNLQSSGPGIGGGITAVFNKTVMAVSNRLIAQSSEMGALPTLYAATFPDLPGGSYIGPDGLFEQRGHPKPVGCSGAARDPETARRLWEASEDLTGVEFGLPAAAPS
jgi:NAD(P)-dependent dehydrogenase (short-subunit alcohol dehydrogenase family)